MRGLRFAVIPAGADFDPVLVVVAFAVFRFVLVIWTSGLGWLAPSRRRHPFRPRRICRLGRGPPEDRKSLVRPSPCTLPLPGKSSGNPRFSQETTLLLTSVILWSGLPLRPFRVGPLALSLAHRDIHGRLAEILNLGDEGRGSAMVVAGARNQLYLLFVAIGIPRIVCRATLRH